MQITTFLLLNKINRTEILQNNNTRLNGGSLSLNRDVSATRIRKWVYNEAARPFNLKHGGRKTLKTTLEDETPTVLFTPKW